MKKIKIDRIIKNPENPRVIKDEKFEDLKTSIQEFPNMLEIRPIVLNEDYMVLGGNMRLEACRDLGMKTIPVIIADNLTPEQQREFTIKDNVSFGDWDWDALGDSKGIWDREDLAKNGIFLPIAERMDYEQPDFDDEAFEDDEPKGKSDMYVSVICPECAKEFDVKIS